MKGASLLISSSLSLLSPESDKRTAALREQALRVRCWVNHQLEFVRADGACALIVVVDDINVGVSGWAGHDGGDGVGTGGRGEFLHLLTLESGVEVSTAFHGLQPGCPRAGAHRLLCNNNTGPSI